ncbi:MAG: acyclic terpene utilization AtuA family protein [Beijerinckiaceae bacterium]
MSATSGRMVRIGGGAGFWGDSPEGPAQLVRAGVDYLALDYLAEITMSILARMKAKNASLGYATDFVSHVMRPLAREIAGRGVKVIANAGGVNLEACRDALRAALAEQGVDLKIAIVRGDDLLHKAQEFRAGGVTEMFRGEPMPEKIASINAYLGAFPIAAALDAGAQVVLTGRCVDSALALGPLIHEFGWRASDYDLLSAGTLVGHLIECGAQVTGGILTDWRAVDGWDRMGFPIAECRADGSFELTKPAETGGLVSVATVSEQMTYEVGDPAAYIVPDVICDWRDVRVEQTGLHRVRLSGARGLPPTRTYKASATYSDGYRASVTMMLVGREARERAEAVGRAIIARATRLMQAAGFAPFADASMEIIGSESSYGAQSRARSAREVVLKIGVRHAERGALDIFSREIYPAATAMAQSLTGFAGGRPEPQPVIRLFSFLVDRAKAPASVEIDGQAFDVIDNAPNEPAPASPPRAPPQARELSGKMRPTPLIALAYGRSGDKGDTANIGVIARRPEFLDAIRAAATPGAVQRYMRHFVEGEVERFEWPGLGGFNFLLHRALGGGGVSSLRHDPQGKAFAQILLEMEIPAPAAWFEAGGPLANWRDEIGESAA